MQEFRTDPSNELGHLMPQAPPPVPFVQVIGEIGGKFVETRGLIEFPEGHAGPKRLHEIRWWDARPVPVDGMWLRVDPRVTSELRPLGGFVEG